MQPVPSLITIIQKIHANTMGCLLDLAPMGLLKVEGPDARALLQGQLTCQMDDIIRQQVGFGAHCNPQGRAISFFRAFYLLDHFYLQMPRTMVPIALAALKKYAVFYKVGLADVSDEWAQLGHYGATRPDTTGLPDQVHRVDLAGRTVFLGERSQVAHLSQQLAQCSVKAEGPLWQWLDIQAGVPAIYPETSEKYLPHELNLPQLNAVSFTKGCYTGQEIIARMQYRGKLKTHLYRAAASGLGRPQRGADIYSIDRVAGSLLDFVQTDQENFELLIITSQQGPLFMDIQKNTPLNLL